MAGERSGPVRTCVGCRGRAHRSALLRVVAVGSGPARALPDPRRVMPGRGASLHLDPGCLDLAERRRALPRALRVEGPLDLAAVRAHVEDHARRDPAGADEQGSGSDS